MGILDLNNINTESTPTFLMTLPLRLANLSNLRVSTFFNLEFLCLMFLFLQNSSAPGTSLTMYQTVSGIPSISCKHPSGRQGITCFENWQATGSPQC